MKMSVGEPPCRAASVSSSAHGSVARRHRSLLFDALEALRDRVILVSAGPLVG
jgi:hypothetical protein